MNYRDYWEECVSTALDEVDIVATQEQIESIAGDVEVSHENCGMAFGHDAIPNPLRTENDQLKRDLKTEREKIICEVCHGKGINVSYGGTFQATSPCWKCKGEGRHSP